MSKEWLEEIKRQLEETNSYDDNPKGYWYHNINRLIEQVERVQELEEDNENLQTLSRINRKESMRLHEQNKSYRKILEKVRQNMIGHYKLGGERDTYVRWSKELIDKVLEGEE